MEIIKPGTEVELWEGGKALVTGATISPALTVRYWISYWNGQQLVEQLVEEAVIRDKDGREKLSVGFR